ncbi:hypothetical protein [Synechococcus sp. CS-1332]|uniref:hypothetical protein n=1 Tax=Synechococcus sp. CS-1332 TaxID=2847972 RepID=UPI00223A79FC|nr:hypothetical protein [Synechococcus sp. CS-1332]MCT0208659.1 hypothetical protein [Synechococcus sp. CS-1332]
MPIFNLTTGAANASTSQQLQRQEGGQGFSAAVEIIPKRAKAQRRVKSGLSSMKKVENAINSSRFTWRNPNSIAEELKLDISEVIKILSNRSIYIKSKNLGEDGAPLFTTKTKYRETTPLLSVLLNSISGEAPIAQKG